MSVYSFTAKSIDGSQISLDTYRGKVLLVVNVASACGFTPQYEGLEAMYRKYQDRGFVILGFPCNQFGSQESGTENAIREFCSTKFDVTFPLFAKVEVNGDGAHPLYQYLKQECRGILRTEAIKWNFTKFLVDKTGEAVERFAPIVALDKVARRVEALL